MRGLDRGAESFQRRPEVACSPLLMGLPSVLLALAIVAMASLAPLWSTPNAIRLDNPDLLPSGQAEFLIKNNIRGNVFNDYSYAPYFDWKLYGRCKFFIDTANAYGDWLLTPFGWVLAADDRGMDYLDQNNVVCVIGRNKFAGETEFPPLYYRLTQDPRWQLRYFGKDGPIWVRRPIKGHLAIRSRFSGALARGKIMR